MAVSNRSLNCLIQNSDVTQEKIVENTSYEEELLWLNFLVALMQENFNNNNYFQMKKTPQNHFKSFFP